MAQRAFLSVLAAAGFSLLAILNVGGYRYGVQDQSFYLPAVLRHLDPDLFQRDTLMLEAQDIFFFFDDAVGKLAQATNWSLPTIFFGLFIVGLVALGAATAVMGWRLYGSWWTVTALTLGVTLRHRISLTAVNTLEGYLHPRMLAFAVGLAALAVFMRGRPWYALLIAAGAVFLHPTTALWFLIVLSVAVAVTEHPLPRPLLLGTLIGAPMALSLAMPLLRDRLVVMDDAWLSVLTHKSYLFTTDWTWTAWVANLGTAAVIAGVYFYRYRSGLVSRRETGLVTGCAALLLVFVLSLPLVDLRLALAVQLQTARIFWLLDFIATASLAWFLTESAIWKNRSFSPGSAKRLVVALVALATVTRGVYVTFMEHPERPIVSVKPANNDWTRTMTWVAQTDPGTHLLADPAHAWRHGTSVRVSGERDVYLEEVKDPAIAIYSRSVAQRILERIHDLGPFDALTTDRARLLADKYDLHYLVATRPFDLPIVHQAGPFKVYALDRQPSSQVVANSNLPMR
ncbi:MAG: hypothetical protein VX453_01260 [Acidobacteriota bacterium]|nr:hypothetical protein [Acidobacteriota bacterium]